MGTNFYAIILPTKKRKQELIDAIKNDDVYSVKDICEENYNQIGKYPYFFRPSYGTVSRKIKKTR